MTRERRAALPGIVSFRRPTKTLRIPVFSEPALPVIRIPPQNHPQFIQLVILVQEYRKKLIHQVFEERPEVLREVLFIVMAEVELVPHDIVSSEGWVVAEGEFREEKAVFRGCPKLVHEDGVICPDDLETVQMKPHAVFMINIVDEELVEKRAR